jgi:hypothetical protein
LLKKLQNIALGIDDLRRYVSAPSLCSQSTFLSSTRNMATHVVAGVARKKMKPI